MNFKTLYKEVQFHGAKRLIDKKFRFYWILYFIFLFCSSVAVVCVTINRYFQGPSYNVNLDSTNSKMRFPTVQICPEVNYSDNKMDQFVKSVKYPSSMNATYIRSVLKQLAAFSSQDVVFDTKDLENIQDLLEFNNLDIEEVTRDLTSSCEEILLKYLYYIFNIALGALIGYYIPNLFSATQKCRWIRKIVNCSSIFRLDITPTGYCCVFNGRSLKREISGYVEKREAFTDDLSFDFENILMFAVEQRNNPLDLDLDYKWLNIQTGNHYADVIENGTAVSPGEEWHIKYRTKTVQVSPSAISLNYDLRGCRLSQEPLKYFPIYHKFHCLLECEIDRTMKRCDCLKLAHPRLFGMPLCRANRLICARQASVSFAIEECNCLTTCDVELQYSVPEAFDLATKVHTVDTFYDDLNLERSTVIRVIVQKHKKKIFQRNTYFIWLNLFSQLGGIFNVFLGCSVLTLLEIMQLGWRALRIYCYR